MHSCAETRILVLREVESATALTMILTQVLAYGIIFINTKQGSTMLNLFPLDSDCRGPYEP